MATLSELLAQKAALEQQIIEAQREEKAAAIGQIKALMSQYGLTLADIGGRVPAGAAKRAAAGSKVAVKFRDPATGSTWSGRGLRPNWLKAALASGRSLSEFSV